MRPIILMAAMAALLVGCGQSQNEASSKIPDDLQANAAWASVGKTVKANGEKIDQFQEGITQRMDAVEGTVDSLLAGQEEILQAIQNPSVKTSIGDIDTHIVSTEDDPVSSIEQQVSDSYRDIYDKYIVLQRRIEVLEEQCKNCVSVSSASAGDCPCGPNCPCRTAVSSVSGGEQIISVSQPRVVSSRIVSSTATPWVSNSVSSGCNNPNCPKCNPQTASAASNVTTTALAVPRSMQRRSVRTGRSVLCYGGRCYLY